MKKETKEKTPKSRFLQNLNKCYLIKIEFTRQKNFKFDKNVICIN